MLAYLWIEVVDRVEKEDMPFFILEISSLSKRPLVFSCSGQLMVTTSHWPSISSRVSTRLQPISFSISGLSGW